MGYVKIDTDLFGKLEIPVKEGLMEDYTIDIDGKAINTTLYILENFIDSENVRIVKHFLENIVKMYETAKEEILENRDTDETIRFFIDNERDNMDEENLSQIFQTDSTDNVTDERFVEKLEPRLIRIAPNDDTGHIECSFDLSLGEEYSDELLVVSFNQQLSVDYVTHES